MNLVFRVDGDAKMGTGHVMRCLALAQALAKNDIKAHFVISASTQSICQGRQDWSGEVIVLPTNIAIGDEAKWLAKLCQDLQADALVLDGYQFDANYRKSVRELTPCLVLFDDNNDSGELHGDVIINGAENAAELGYELSATDAVLCLGAPYRVLRQEFVDLTTPMWVERQALGIMMGGSDPLNLTIPLLAALQAQSQQGQLAPIRLLTGPAYPFASQLKAFLSQTSLSIEHHANCQQVAEVFVQCRLVISAAGSSQFELLACQTPAILLVVANNQLNATVQAKAQGWCLMYDARDKLDFPSLADEILALYQNEQALEQMYQLSGQYKDTGGAQRVVEAIVQRCQDKE